MAEIQREEKEEVGEGMYGMYNTIRYNTEVYLPSFPPVSVNDIPKKYRPIPNRNTDSGCNSSNNPFFCPGSHEHHLFPILKMTTYTCTEEDILRVG